MAKLETVAKPIRDPINYMSDLQIVCDSRE